MSVRLFRHWTLGTLAFTVGVILWGGYVRATGSGAGCGAHWPACQGVVVPRAPSAQTLIEYTHRLTSGLAFLSVLVMAWLSRRTLQPRAPARRWAAWALGFMVLEALAGAALVKLELVAHNASANRAVAMSVHLVLTFGLLAVMVLTAWHAWFPARASEPRRPATVGTSLALGLVVLVGVSGAVAALGDTLVQHAVSSPLVELLVRLRVIHPLLAIGGTLAVVAVVVDAWSRAASRRWAALVGALLAAQVGGGLLNVWLAAPVWMQLIHLFFADALWMALVVVSRELAASPTPRRAAA